MAEENKEIKPEEKTPLQKIDEIHNLFVPADDKKLKKKELKIPKISKGKAKKGWVIVEKIDTNRNISFEKQQVAQDIFKMKDGILHATDGREIFFYKNLPLIHQPAWRINPFDPVTEKGELTSRNNVYGLKPILAEIESGKYVEQKKRGGLGGIWMIILIIGGGYLLGHSLLHIF
ncbi:MAG: hypothetical protein ABSG05_03470 [Candidatus Pacearchaeota archaeon]|jgi:hypothetical protein